MLLAVCQERGIDAPAGVIPEIACAFGGGIGNTGSLCGSLIGAVMAIGLARGRGASTADYLRTAEIVQTLRTRFEADMGSSTCRELTGMEMRTPEQIEQFVGSDAPATVCIPAVTTAYRLVLDLVADAP